jgi:uncharacterized membrane protein
LRDQETRRRDWQLRATILLRSANLIAAAVAVLAPMAHVLELPNKLALDGQLWVAVQQHLYRGWGPIIGGPVEFAALVTSVALLVMRRRDRRTARFTLAAAVAYGAMIVTFFVFNDPVNAALNTWTPESFPVDWQAYRTQWEMGHALAAFFSLFALAAILRAWLIERNGEIADSR